MSLPTAFMLALCLVWPGLADAPNSFDDLYSSEEPTP